ncbi:2-hydroxyacid dehydrogenase [Xanthovirga aplysinae]|uniref:2-hydroxyacid dehydrogenase n=1 Tax=Xanthovirga aplysinae TaxID=2529853 RepID=UPI0012BD2824|nr:glyoxylate/hydroxypyruvate reductase A [Xanthovirga aplysinae]MTI32972.1 glyoxylate/hydroxypyruvate reductase A [Xanthovirga aplysinae]
MSILIISKQKNTKLLVNALRKKIRNTPIYVYPEDTPKEIVEYVLCWKAEKDILQNFPNLKAIQSLGAGVEHIFDTQNISQKIPVARIVDPQLSEDMWEFLLAITLNHIKNLPLYHSQQVKQEWQQHAYKTIKSTTVSILGLGKIGSFVAGNFGALGFPTQGWSTSKKEIKFVKSYFGESGLIKMLQNTDVLINLLPLTNSTKGILNKKNLIQLKKGAFLINVGRGAHLLEKDLLKLLDAGYLSAAALDVFNQEPLPPDHPFWKHPKIRITPHNASLTNIETALEQIVENYHRMKKNQPLLNQVSHKKGY